MSRKFLLTHASSFADFPLVGKCEFLINNRYTRYSVRAFSIYRRGN